jgi:predicted nucleic acid-binding protein
MARIIITNRWIDRGSLNPGSGSMSCTNGWRGPRTDAELHDQEALFPEAAAFEFGAAEAAVAAKLYRQVRNPPSPRGFGVASPRGRSIDLAIAACAIVQNAALWTLNPQDFKDIPGLELIARSG